jgi:putative aminopeptidase FrvX
MDNLLERLCKSFGVSGSEEAVREIIKEELKDICCETKEDKMGNLIVKMGEGQEKIMFSSHMDQIGVIVTYIEDSGIARIGNIGTLKAEEIVHNFVKFENGTIGKIASSKDNPSMADLYIDFGLTSREEVLKKVREGDTAAFESPYLNIGNNVVSPSLNNRVGCYILLKLIKEIKTNTRETYFVFSTQQELGGRGARAAAYAIKPNYCIVVDLEGSGDVPGANGELKLGKGPAISIMNRTLIIHHEIKAMLENAAKKSEVELQYAISTEDTDGGHIHKEVGGIKTGVFSVPCRYLHSVSEMVCLGDVEDAIKVLTKLV